MGRRIFRVGLTSFWMGVFGLLIFLPNWVAAQLPPGMAPFETTKVADGVYSFRAFFHRNMFIVTDEGVIATDPISPRAAQAMMEEIRKVTDKPVKYVVYSHWHWDHIPGGKVFADQGAKFISHENCLKHFKENPNPDVVIPTGTFRTRYDLKLGGKTLELRYFGRNHSDCLIVMRLPKEKILFIVDIASVGSVGFRALPDYYPRDWARSLKEIEKLDFDRIIPGHGPPVAPRSAVTETREYVEDLIAAVQEARKQGWSQDKAKQEIRLPKYEKWAFYNEWLPLNVERVWSSFHIGW